MAVNGAGPESRRGGEVERGMALMIVGMLVVPVMDALGKHLGQSMAPGQVTWGRVAFQAAILLPFVLAAGRRLPRRHLGLHVARGFLTAVSTLFFFAALTVMPLADTVAIFFVEPLILTLLSALFLGERIGWRRLSAVAVGLAGALIVIRPSFAAFGLHALLPLGAALTFALYLLITRKLAPYEDAAVLQLTAGLTGCLFMSLGLAAGAVLEIPMLEPSWPSAWQWFLMLLLGAVATFSHMLVVLAFRHAPAGVLAPFQYLEIISATILGLAVFGDFPDALTWLGIAVIVGSGLYVFHRERTVARRG
ncbi:DMT family transporter [Geminicoccaceae bacterium 1502E]|nr:DMT family transporter [Geminicoccaceae bacterium 1502E]